MAMAKMFRQLTRLGITKIQSVSYSSTSTTHPKTPALTTISSDNRFNTVRQTVQNIPRKDKISFLITTLSDLDDSKDMVYGALDAWVAWDQNFPIGQLKNVLLALEKSQQWHREIQVIKWMLSKGQGNTMGTYGQLIRALDMDRRPEEAHEIWRKKIGLNLHSVPWQLCHVMISVYYRNNRWGNVVRLFKGLEAFDRKPPERLIVQKVADAYEMLGLVEEKEKVILKYHHLFVETTENNKKKKWRSKKQRKLENECSSLDVAETAQQARANLGN